MTHFPNPDAIRADLAKRPPIDPDSELARNLRQTLIDVGAVVGAVNVANGWDTSRAMLAAPIDYDDRWLVAHKIAELGLITTEVAEAIEEVRHGHAMAEQYHSVTVDPKCPVRHGIGPDALLTRSPECTCRWKPEGVPSELADVVIRVLDICDAYGIDLGAALVEKINSNATRGLHHGGKAL